MTTAYDDSDGFASRSDWIRLQTLVTLRWLAILGQLVTLLMAWRFFDIAINTTPCLAIVGLSVAANLASMLFYQPNRRLTEHEALSVLMFDSCQLAALLYLTGGLSNPFALLLLVPSTVAATALNDASTIIVGAVTIALVTGLAYFYQPLRYADGAIIAIPQIIAVGFWVAIIIGVFFLALYARRISAELHAMSDALLATQMALARSQKLTDLSGVVAAAAHELGTPLATIKLASSELAAELHDRPDLKADATLIRAQADRCRDILRSMGRVGKDDLQMRAAPLQAVVEEAAEPHSQRKAQLIFELPKNGAPQPLIHRRPEVIHGLRNLVQNAVDFAAANVWIELDWTENYLTVTITDDGSGFPSGQLGRIGDPFMRRGVRPDQLDMTRPHYEGMGLGLFIAKTLLERTGAQLTFTNLADPFLTERERPAKCGARVKVRWPRVRIEAVDHDISGENQLLQS